MAERRGEGDSGREGERRGRGKEGDGGRYEERGDVEEWREIVVERRGEER